MNYEQRIQALRSLRSRIASGVIDNTLSSIDSDIPGWVGGLSKEQYQSYIHTISRDTDEMVSQKQLFENEMDQRIQSIQNQFDNEYSTHTGYFTLRQDVDPVRNRQIKLQYLNRLYVDDSVKNKLRRNFF